MSNLVDIQNQIEKLQKQAADIKTREFRKTVDDIVAKMHAFGITVKDLQPAGKRGKGGGGSAKKAPPVALKKKKSTAPSVAAKYRGPEGETWSGRGLTPRWLAALVSQGKNKDDFAIKA